MRHEVAVVPRLDHRTLRCVLDLGISGSLKLALEASWPFSIAGLWYKVRCIREVKIIPE